MQIGKEAGDQAFAGVMILSAHILVSIGVGIDFGAAWGCFTGAGISALLAFGIVKGSKKP